MQGKTGSRAMEIFDVSSARTAVFGLLLATQLIASVCWYQALFPPPSYSWSSLAWQPVLNWF